MLIISSLLKKLTVPVNSNVEINTVKWPNMSQGEINEVVMNACDIVVLIRESATRDFFGLRPIDFLSFSVLFVHHGSFEESGARD